MVSRYGELPSTVRVHCPTVASSLLSPLSTQRETRAITKEYVMQS